MLRKPKSKMRITNTRKAVINLAQRSTRKPRMTYRQARDHFMSGYVADVLHSCGGDKHATAKALDISYSSVKEKMRPDFGS